MTRTKLRYALIATERERCAKIADARHAAFEDAEEADRANGDLESAKFYCLRANDAFVIAREIRSGK